MAFDIPHNEEGTFCDECNSTVDMLNKNDPYYFCTNCLQVICTNCAYDREYDGNNAKCPQCKEQLACADEPRWE